MTSAPEKLVADVIAAYGGKLVGKVRLQKVFYLLDQVGLQSGFDYELHHFGPYSSELSAALLSAEASGLVHEAHGVREVDGASYSIFETSEIVPDRIGSLEIVALEHVFKSLQSRTAVVLELAATAHWISEVENLDDWVDELTRRKKHKTGAGREAEAVELLRELGLPPAVAA